MKTMKIRFPMQVLISHGDDIFIPCIQRFIRLFEKKKKRSELNGASGDSETMDSKSETSAIGEEENEEPPEMTREEKQVQIII